jgi:hypothetical protein
MSNICLEIELDIVAKYLYSRLRIIKLANDLLVKRVIANNPRNNSCHLKLKLEICRVSSNFIIVGELVVSEIPVADNAITPIAPISRTPERSRTETKTRRLI